MWAIVTGSDIKDAPGHRITANSRTHTGGASAAVLDLIRRGGPALTAAVHDIADRLAHAIDSERTALRASAEPTDEAETVPPAVLSTSPVTRIPSIAHLL